MTNLFVDFEDDIRWMEGYHQPETDQFGIWTPKAPPQKDHFFYIVNSKKNEATGPFSRQRILRAYVIANTWMQNGGEYTWDYGFSVLLKGGQPLKGQIQDYIRVDPQDVSPSLTLYAWSKNLSENPPLVFDPPRKPAFPKETIKSLLNLYELNWPLDSVSVGSLAETRSIHPKGSAVLTRSQKAGETYAVVDRVEDYPALCR